MFLVLPVKKFACESGSEADATMTPGTSHDAMRPYPLWKNSFGTKVEGGGGSRGGWNLLGRRRAAQAVTTMSSNQY